MARSRLISCSLSTSARFYSLFRIAGELAEFCQSLYPLVVIHTDDHGRMAGDAFTVKMKCHPSSPRSVAEFDDALGSLDKAGLIRRAEHGGEMFLQVVGFDDFQTGLHKRRDSKFPELPGTSGKIPVELELEPESELEPEPKRTEGGVAAVSPQPHRTNRPTQDSIGADRRRHLNCIGSGNWWSCIRGKCVPVKMVKDWNAQGFSDDYIKRVVEDYLKTIPEGTALPSDGFKLWGGVWDQAHGVVLPGARMSNGDSTLAAANRVMARLIERGEA